MASGIYVIRNQLDGMRYIGSAQILHKRWREHRWALEHKKHHSWKLQRAYLRAGTLDVFTFEVVEHVADLSLLIPREQHYLDALMAEVGGLEYNISPTAGNTAGIIRHEAWRLAISAAKKGKTKGDPWSKARRTAQPKRSGDTLTEAQRAAYAARSLRPRTERELARDELIRTRPPSEAQWASIRKAAAASRAKPRTEKQVAAAKQSIKIAHQAPKTEAQLAALERGRKNGAGHLWSEAERLAAKNRPRPSANEKQRAALDAGREYVNATGMNNWRGRRAKGE